MAETFVCPSCGASLEPHGSDASIQCPYCNDTVIVPEALRAAPPPPAVVVAAQKTGPGGMTEQQALELIALAHNGQVEPAIQRYMQITGATRAHAMRVAATMDRMLEISGWDLTGEQALAKFIAANEVQDTVETAMEKRFAQNGAQSLPQARSRRGGLGCAPLIAVILIGLGIYYFFPQAFGLFGKVLGGGSASGKAIQEQILQTVIPPDMKSVTTQLPGILSTVKANQAVQAAVGGSTGFASVILSKGEQGIGAGMFTDARSIAADGQGKVYVADYIGGRVQVFDASGEYSSQWSVDPKMPLRGLAADRSGTVYVVQSGAISRYNGATGKLLGKIAYARGNGFDDVTIAPNGNIVAVYSSNADDVVVFSPDGRVVQTIKNAVSGQTGDPELNMRVAIDGLGNIYVLGTFNNAVLKYGPDGKYINRWGSSGDQPGQFRSPEDITVDGQGRVYVSDISGIQVFDSTGRYLTTIPMQQEPYFGMAFDASNNLLAAARTKWYLMKISAQNP